MAAHPIPRVGWRKWSAGAEHLCSRAFDCEAKDGMAILPGVVSRKKQVIPAMMSTLAKFEVEDEWDDHPHP